MRTMEIQIPESMRIEHDEIHGELVEATKRDGRIGEAARELAKVLHSHFEREEQIALPPLGLLRPLAAGEFDRGMMEVLGMTDALREELPQMLEEHRAIAAAARKLAHDGFKVALLSSSGKGEALASELGGIGVTGSNQSGISALPPHR